MNLLIESFINTTARVQAQTANRQAQRLVDRLGISLDFPQIPAGWIQGLPVSDLTPIWRKAGLPVAGVGYATLGTVDSHSQVSTRFLPGSPYYQASLGGYILAPEGLFGLRPDGSPAVEALSQVAVADSVARLHQYGCPDPQVSLKPGSIHLVERTRHQGYPAWWVETVLHSHSESGDRNPELARLITYRAAEHRLEQAGAGSLPFLWTRPPATSLPPYHPLTLGGALLIIWLADPSAWVILFGWGAAWEERNYFAALRPEMLGALRAARIILKTAPGK